MVITAAYLLVLVTSFILMGLIALVDSASVAKKIGKQNLHISRILLLILLVIAIVYLCLLNFPVTLTLIVFISGIIVAIDFIFFAKKRKKTNQEPRTLVKNSREFFPILLLVWVIRSFIIQPYHVPSGSLEPTILVGDFIVANQFAYGLKFPIGNFTLFKTGEPKIGDIVLFYDPMDPSQVFIKRLIGSPGDHIVYKNKILYVNDKEAKQILLAMAEDLEPDQDPMLVNRMLENLNGVNHEIFVHPIGGEMQDFDFIVPQGQYFVMGDNRDESNDSRTGFGSDELTFVPEKNFIAKASRIWMSWDANDKTVRWNRIGKVID